MMNVRLRTVEFIDANMRWNGDENSLTYVRAKQKPPMKERG